MKSIWIVEDEPDIADLIAHTLSRQGFKTATFGDGESFLQATESALPNLVILDLMLPGLDGLDVCKLIRSNDRTASMPIIILTAKGTELDIVLGLELGADDYIVKPFSARELVARVKAVLRRIKRSQETDLISIGNLQIDLRGFSTTVDGNPVDLTFAEFKILGLLASNMGRVFTRQQIIDRIWEEGKTVTRKTIDVHVAHLRKKLGEYGSLIKAVRGVGYKIEA